jgi:hypothetical protein
MLSDPFITAVVLLKPTGTLWFAGQLGERRCSRVMVPQRGHRAVSGRRRHRGAEPTVPRGQDEIPFGAHDFALTPATLPSLGCANHPVEHRCLIGELGRAEGSELETGVGFRSSSGSGAVSSPHALAAQRVARAGRRWSSASARCSITIATLSSANVRSSDKPLARPLTSSARATRVRAPLYPHSSAARDRETWRGLEESRHVPGGPRTKARARPPPLAS